MKVRLATILVAATTTLTTACGSSPTEPVSSPARPTGTLVIVVTQPCALEGTVSVFLDGTELGVLIVPGETRFPVPTGTHSFFLRRGASFFAAAGTDQVQIVAGGITTLTDPIGVCVSSPVH